MKKYVRPEIATTHFRAAVPALTFAALASAAAVGALTGIAAGLTGDDRSYDAPSRYKDRVSLRAVSK